jgi:hypothetical protein
VIGTGGIAQPLLTLALDGGERLFPPELSKLSNIKALRRVGEIVTETTAVKLDNFALSPAVT